MSEKKIGELMAEIDRIRMALTERIGTLPDNPRIHRMSEHAFIMSSKDLGDVWSAEYHDFKHQYRKIIDYLIQGEPQACYAKLERALQLGRLENSEKTKLHPEVVNHVKGILRQAE